MSGCCSIIPYKTVLPGGVLSGTVVKIRVVVPQWANRFHVFLLFSDCAEADTVLHFTPRMDTSQVVFNTREQGRWCLEERSYGVPFHRGQPFEVLIIVNDQGFKTVVGDNEYYLFHHRLSPSSVRLLEVSRDVQLHSVKIF